MKQLLLIFSIVLLTSSAEAQTLHIVKDNVNCSYGLKDKDGNWVIDPIYTLIQEYNSGYFLVKDPMGDGILTPAGKWLVPCEYDRFDDQISGWKLMYNNGYSNNAKVADKDFFLLGIKGDQKKLMNARGKVLCSMGVDANCERDNEAHFLIHEASPTSATYIDTSGKVLINKKPGAILPFRERNYSLHGKSVVSYGRISAGEVRMINQNGEKLNNQVYDRAMLVLRDRISVELNGKHGIISADGNVLIEPKYKWEMGLGNPTDEGWVILDEQGHKGIMKSTGQVLIEPVYDKLYDINGRNSRKEGWMVEKGEKKGVLDLSGNWLIPLEYDKIERFYVFDRQHRMLKTNYVVWKSGMVAYIRPDISKAPEKFYSYLEPISDYDYTYKQSIGYGLIFQQNGKYGILNPDGTVFVNGEFEQSMKRGTSDERYWFISGRGLVEFAFKRSEIERRDWKPFLELDDKVVYSFQRLFTVAQLSGDRKKIIEIGDDNYAFNRYGNMLVLNRDEHGVMNLYNYETTKKIHLKNVTQIEQSGNNRFVIRTRSNNAGVVDKNGKIIIDTAYNTIDLQNGGEHIWASKFYSNNEYKWLLLDSNGVQIVNASFDQSFRINSGDQLVKDGYNTGLMDTKTLKWKIQPTHPCLYQLVDQYYITITENRKKGVVRSNGTYLIQPIYDTIILLAANTNIGGYIRSGVEPEFYWLVRQGNRELLIDHDGKQTSSLSAIRDFKASLLFDDTLLLKTYNQIWNFPVLNYAPSLHFLRNLTPEQVRRKKQELWKNPRIKSVIYDSINKEWEARNVVCSQRNTMSITSFGLQTTNEEYNQLQQLCQCAQQNKYGNARAVAYKLMSVGPKFATLAREYPYYNHGWEYQFSQAPIPPPADEHWNFIERNNKVENVALSDIFPNDSTLMDEFMEALQKRDDLQLECSSIETMLEMVNGRFRLMEDGISLYLDRNHQAYYGAYTPIELFIPLENLEKHPESKWIVSILKAK